MMLAGGDRRSVGRVSEVLSLADRHPQVTDSLVKLLSDEDSCVRMRAADALEKLSHKGTILIQPHAACLLDLLAETKQPELRWHLAVILPRLRLTDAECSRVAHTLQSYLTDKSSIVKTFAMQGLADLANQCAGLQPIVADMIEGLTRTGTPAMRARGRRLLPQILKRRAGL